MTKRIKIAGANPRKIAVLDQPKRRIEPTLLAAAVGASRNDEQVPGNVDLIALAELGTVRAERPRPGESKTAQGS